MILASTNSIASAAAAIGAGAVAAALVIAFRELRRARSSVLGEARAKRWRNQPQTNKPPERRPSDEQPPPVWIEGEAVPTERVRREIAETAELVRATVDSLDRINTKFRSSGASDLPRLSERPDYRQGVDRLKKSLADLEALQQTVTHVQEVLDSGTPTEEQIARLRVAYVDLAPTLDELKRATAEVDASLDAMKTALEEWERAKAQAVSEGEPSGSADT